MARGVYLRDRQDGRRMKDDRVRRFPSLAEVEAAGRWSTSEEANAH
ncbi:hypothetical protein ACWD4F_17040 [Streptomyces aureus]|nr:hypothetical protein [Streptomyces aureus]